MMTAGEGEGSGTEYQSGDGQTAMILRAFITFSCISGGRPGCFGFGGIPRRMPPYIASSVPIKSVFI